MSTRTKEASEGDVIVARALSSYAQLRANIASWSGLPAAPATASGKADDKEEEFFNGESETAGVGYIAPQDGERTKTSTDKLRKQMLGKRTRGGHARLERISGPKPTAISRKGVHLAAKDDLDSEEDEGRSAVGKKRKYTGEPVSTSETKADLDKIHCADSNSSGVSRKVPNSYLDELLAKRSKKRKKKKKQAKGPE